MALSKQINSYLDKCNEINRDISRIIKFRATIENYLSRMTDNVEVYLYKAHKGSLKMTDIGDLIESQLANFTILMFLLR